MVRPSHAGRRLTIAVVSVGAIAVAVAGVAGYSWYYKHYKWPREIQVEILGEVIVDHDSLRRFEGRAHFGEGMFRWEYTAPDATGSAWVKYCGSQKIAACQFTLQGKPEPNVETSVSYRDGVVMIEEWWM